jgi:sRNA-binding carbon storage regulator CsrA
MLVIARHEMESIKIDGPCTIYFLGLNRGKIARIGIEADRDVNVVRSGCKSGPKPRGEKASKAA